MATLESQRNRDFKTASAYRDEWRGRIASRRKGCGAARKCMAISSDFLTFALDYPDDAKRLAFVLTTVVKEHESNPALKLAPRA